MDPDSITYWILLTTLLLIYFLLSLTETAIVSLSDAKVHKMAEEGNRKAKKILRVTSQPGRFLGTFQIGTLFCAVFAAGVASGGVVTLLEQRAWYPEILSSGVLRTLVLVGVALLLTFFMMVLGELVPKRMGGRHAEAIAFALVGPFGVFYSFMRPFVALATTSAGGLLRLFGVPVRDERETVTEEEIRMMVDAGEEKGSIEQSEKDMINNIFEFDDRTASEVMTHRTEIAAVEKNASIHEVVDIAIQQGYSRIPVYEDDLDNIVGIIYVKDLLKLICDGGLDSFRVDQYMRKPLFVPESNRCRDLFTQMKEKKVQMAVLVDEYGGTSGIITMEDLIETIVGNIQDEYDNEEEEFSKISEDAYNLDGSLAPSEVEQILDIEIPDSEEYDTIGGYIIDLLGRIPTADEHPEVVIDGYRFTVLNTEDWHIDRVLAEKIIVSEPEEPVEKSKGREKEKDKD